MPHDHDHDRGLIHDLEVLTQSALRRRRALGWLAGAGLGSLPLIGAAAGPARPGSGGTSSGGSSGSTSGSSSCPVIAEETAGPYPGDGSNTSNGSIANALMLSGIVRSDIRSSIAGASGTAGGVPVTLTLKLVNSNASCAALSGYAIYLWHCDRDGNYSMYSSAVVNQNYLRGVQSTGSDGTVTFTTIFPGCYSGRWPHMHFEVYRSANSATSYSNKLRTSQIALPAAVCQTVYNNASGYSASASNFSRASLSSDNVFSDGVSTETPTVTGSVAAGYTATMTVPISV